MKKSIWFITILFLTAVLSGYGADQKQVTNATQTPVPSGILTNGVRVVQVQAKHFEFIPNPIIVNGGEQVRLEFTTLDDAHGFSLPAFNITKDILPGKTTTVTLSTNAAGTYPFHCSVFCGMGHFGMSGNLVVISSSNR
jgi:heme/copper-type cytochrome/quinol oxidase subunit 2